MSVNKQIKIAYSAKIFFFIFIFLNFSVFADRKPTTERFEIATGGEGGIELSDNGRLVSVENHSRYLIYLYGKDSDVHSDYAEGWIKVYDIKNRKERDLYKEKCVYEFVRICWSDSDKIYFSEGEKILHVNLNTHTTKQILRVSKEMMLLDFVVSPDGNELIYNIFNGKPEVTYQSVIKLDLKTGKKKELYRIRDPRMGGFDVNYLFYGESPDKVFLININKKLLSINLQDLKIDSIDSGLTLNIDQLVFHNHEVYYAKGSNILCHNLKTGKKSTVIESKDDSAKIEYFGKGNQNSIFVSISSRILLYHKDKSKVSELDVPNSDPIVFCNHKIAIQSIEMGTQNKTNYKLVLYQNNGRGKYR